MYAMKTLKLDTNTNTRILQKSISALHLRGMKTYYCEQCGFEKKLKPKEYRKLNPEAWCYHNVAVPIFLSPISFKKMVDYSHVFRALNSLPPTSLRKGKARNLPEGE